MPGLPLPQDVKQHLDSDANSLEQQLQQVEAQGFNGIAQQKAWDEAWQRNRDVQSSSSNRELDGARVELEFTWS
eukprot:Skav227960  [mRNA]  locus=scaffold146:733910:734131:- [translate_table: standard]